MLRNFAVLVTGGAGSLGAGAAKKLISEGCKVTLMDLAESPGGAVAKKLGENAMFVPGDVTKVDDVINALDQSKEKFGALKGVVNCAAVHGAFELFNENRKEIPDFEYAENIMRVNVLGTLNVIRLAVKYMSENPVDRDNLRGLIVNTSGFGAFDGQLGQSVLCGAWGAIASMTMPLCRELSAHGIRVMAISPGLMESNLMHLIPSKILDAFGALTPAPKRLGYQEEYGDLVVTMFKNKFLNGEVIRLDGGLRVIL